MLLSISCWLPRRKSRPFRYRRIGFRVGGDRAGELRLLFPAQLAHQRSRDRAGYLALDLEHVVGAAGVFLAPQVRGVADPHQLRRDGQARSALREAAEDEGVHPELSADLHRLHLPVLEGEGGCAGDDTQAVEGRELVDEALRYSVAEVADRGIAAGILEWQHGHRADRGAPGAHPVRHDAPHGEQRGHCSRAEQEVTPARMTRWRGDRPRACGPALDETGSPGDSRRNIRATKLAGTSPAGTDVHCTSRNLSGTRASPSRVSSMTTGSRNALSAAIRWERSTASFHSSRKYPSARARVFAEMIGMNKVQALICFRIAASQASPPRSSLWSNQTSIPPSRSVLPMRVAASASSEA
jgi:hypothetical protein